MVIADDLDSPTPTERIDEMHHSAAGNHEDGADSHPLQSFGEVICDANAPCYDNPPESFRNERAAPATQSRTNAVSTP